jgi:hypothetical protein
LTFNGLSIYRSTAPVDLGSVYSFLIHTESVGLLGRGISPSQGRYLHTVEHKTYSKRTQTSLLRMRFEPTIPVFERAKTVHALDHAATIIGLQRNTRPYIPEGSTLHATIYLLCVLSNVRVNILHYWQNCAPISAIEGS